jgi:methionine-rich copper-binding protein CopC
MANRSSLDETGLVWILVLFAAMAFTLGNPGPATAHSYLRTSAPVDGASLANFPTEVKLTFSDPILRTGAGLTLLGSDGAVPLQATTDTKRIEAPWPAVSTAAGGYSLNYRAVSDDGHVMSGSIRFRIKANADQSMPTAPGPDAVSAAPAETQSAQAASTSETSGQGVPAWLLGAGGAMGVGAVIIIVLRLRQGDA